LRQSFVLRLTIHHISAQKIVLCPDGYFSQLLIRNMIYLFRIALLIYYHCFMFVSVFFEPLHNSQNIIILILVIVGKSHLRSLQVIFVQKTPQNHLKHQIFHYNYHVMIFVFPKFPQSNCTQRTQIMLIKNKCCTD
jgi:hypothetical protein